MFQKARHNAVLRTVCRILYLLVVSFIAFAGATKNFEPGSYEDILKSRAGRPFVLILWSLDCPSCLHELDFLAEQLNADPDLDLVMVATDDSSARDAVDTMLRDHRLVDRVESWIFADRDDQKLRYEVDPNWYGELPRVYFYDPSHRRVARSGVVTRAHLDAWRSSNQSDRP